MLCWVLDNGVCYIYMQNPPIFRPFQASINSNNNSNVSDVSHFQVQNMSQNFSSRKKLAPLCEWMNSSAGLAFTPQVIHIAVGEDIAEKILSFSQQRPRALCILTGHGAVSAVTLHQPSSVSSTVTYEGRFQILSLTGSYLVADSGVRNRTGGISVTLCSADGHVIGGAVSELIAAGSVQVVVSSFVYDGPKMKNKTVVVPESEEKKSMLLSGEATATPLTMTPC